MKAAQHHDWETCEILGSNISVYELHEVVERMRALVDGGRREYVCVTNVHTTVTGWQDASYRQVTNGAIMATPDGVPLIWASRLFRPCIHGRASGPDILNLFMEQDRERRYRHFFFGSSPDVLDKMRAAIQERWPGTQIAGMFSPPFRSPTPEEDRGHATMINESKADLVWIGLGAPRQELWMARMRPLLEPSLLISVGAAFDFLAGNKPRAPQWMREKGLEWLFRLMSEPRRLFHRYAITNSLFVMGIAGQCLRAAFRRR